MIYDPDITSANLSGEEDGYSLVEQVFDSPKVFNEGEYITIYEFLLSPDIRDDPQMIAGVLEEFAGWAQYMLERMRKSGLIDQVTADE